MMTIWPEIAGKVDATKLEAVVDKIGTAMDIADNADDDKNYTRLHRAFTNLMKLEDGADDFSEKHVIRHHMTWILDSAEATPEFSEEIIDCIIDPRV